MARSSTYNILMYSHDTYGLGHIRRSMAIASHLLGPRVNILILTGSPIAGRFNFPEQIDFVRIPGMIKRTNEEYLPLSIKINARHALDIRKNIITATVKAFQPQLFIVDKEPLGSETRGAARLAMAATLPARHPDGPGAAGYHGRRADHPARMEGEGGLSDA